MFPLARGGNYLAPAHPIDQTSPLGSLEPLTVQCVNLRGERLRGVLSASHNVVLIPSDDESTSGPLTRACAHEKETEEEKESETERQGEQERKRDLALVASSAAWLPLQDHRFCTSSLNLLSPRRSIRIGAGSRARANSNLEIIVPILARLSIVARLQSHCGGARQPADGIGEWIPVAVSARDLSPKPRFALGEVPSVSLTRSHRSIPRDRRDHPSG